MLNLFGAIAGNVLSLPGILGLAIGLCTRNLGLAAFAGALVGVFETLVFADFALRNVTVLELSVAIVVGVIAGSLGSMIRRKGATV